MSRLDNLRRLTEDGDFTDEQREVIRRIAEVFNFHVEQIINVVNGNLDFTNLKSKIVQFDVTVGANGVPISLTQFRSDIGTIGGTVISARNLNNGSIFPVSTPFVVFTPVGNGTYTVNSISGLQSGQSYRIIYKLEFQ